MKRTLSALILLAAWVAALGALGLFVQRQLSIDTDLRSFLPNAQTPEQRLLLEGIGEGPVSRLLVIALEGASTERLAEISADLAEELRADAQFRLVANGDASLSSIPEDLLAYRFLLSPTLDTERLDDHYLRAAIQARARDLSSPAGAILESWLPRDPTLELARLLERWQPLQDPRRELGVWFDREGRRALLVVETVASAFDPAGQRASIAAIQRAFDTVGAAPDTTLVVSGAGSFSVLMEARTRAEAERLGRIATIGMIALLLFAYRGIGSVILSVLPLASAALAGLAAVSALFGTVHGITLAFGFTLIGVAQDYPIHMLSHRRAGADPNEVARSLWPTLATGVASTCIAYFTFLAVGVSGLAQLAYFTVTGLAVAGLTTRFVLPRMIGSHGRDHAESRFLDRAWNVIARLPRPTWLAVALLALCGIVIARAPQPFWENDLGLLTPVPADLLARDRALRQELGTPDLRYLLVVDAPDTQAALERLEALDSGLQRLVEGGVVSAYDHAARYLPAASTQAARRAVLPDDEALHAALAAAQRDSPFRPGVFEPFAADIAYARTLAPLTLDATAATLLSSRVDSLLLERDGHATALVTLSGVSDPAALEAFAGGAGRALLLDLKQASEELVVSQRTRILASLAVAALLLVAVIALALRNRARVFRVLAPMVLTTVVVIAVLQAVGVSLNLFHLISLILVAGLGLDYALFFERAADDAAEQRRTLHAVLVCTASTLFVFTLLATSSLPVLRAIGLPVAIGVASNFVLALILTRPQQRRIS